MHTGNEPADGIMLPENEFFRTRLYRGMKECSLKMDGSSFMAVIILEGEGEVYADDSKNIHRFSAGDTFFIHAGDRNVMLRGSGEFLTVRI